MQRIEKLWAQNHKTKTQDAVSQRSRKTHHADSGAKYRKAEAL
jgi:hypothetical protein